MADVDQTLRASSAFTGRRVLDAHRVAEGLLGHLHTAVALAIRRALACVDEDLRALAVTELFGLPFALQDTIDQALKASLAVQAEATGDESTATLGTFFSLIPAAQIAELLASPLGGARFQQSFMDLDAEILRRLRNILVTGLLRGMSVQRVAREVKELLGRTRWQAERIIRSEFVRVGNQAALEIYRQHRDIVKRVSWSAALDEKTCLQCSNLDGKTFPVDEAPVPVIDTHPNCRCALTPVLRAARELGIPETPTTRAAFNGEAPGAITYPEWFAQQRQEFQKSVLGPTRFKLWSQGKVAFRQFAGARGIRRVSELLKLAS